MNERDEWAVKKSLEQLQAAELRAVFKDAWKELVREYVTEFGWFAAKTLTLLVVGAGIYFILVSNGWTHK